MIIIDTSFIIEAVKRKIELPPYKMLIAGSTFREIRAMSRNRGKKGSYAKAALEIIKKKCYIYPSSLEPDKAVVEIANNYDLVLLTYDLRLRKTVKKYLEIKGDYIEY